jgi:hypothetical protein
MTGAATPIVAKGGQRAMAAVPSEVSQMVALNAARRPPRSAYAPISAAPRGRMKNPTPNVPTASSNDVIGFFEGKN